MRKLSTMFFSLVAFSLFGVTSTALATPTASQITTPTGTAYVGILYGPNQATAVRGTTTGTGDVDLRCYYLGTGVTVKSNVHVTSANTFDTSLTQDDIANSLPARPCVLRAVPAGDTTAHPPSATSDPFQGPRIAPSYSNESVAPPSDATADFDVAGVGGSGLFQFESSWAGIWNSELVNPSTLATTPALFDIGAGFNGGDLINIDGVDAFVVNSVSSQAGWQGIGDLHIGLDPYTGAVTIHDLEPVLHDETTPEPSGVALERTWVTGQDGRVASVRDQWRSVDGQPHRLKVRYQSHVEGAISGGAIDFPGSAGFQNFSTYSLNQEVTVPHGPATAFVKYDATTPDAGNGTAAQGAFTYSKTPDGPVKILTSSTTYLGWELPYDQTIPAGGDQTFRFSYAMDFSLANVRAFAADYATGAHPTLAISAPTDGSSSASPTVTVNGTAADTAGAPSLLVNGQATSVGAGGTWSRQVTLATGANTITAVATDADGNSTTRSVNVSYTPPSSGSANQPSGGTQAAGGTGQAARVSLVGKAVPTKGGMTFKIQCLNLSCAGTTKLQSIELVRAKGGAVTGIRSARTKRKMVTVGSGTFSLAAGSTKTITVKLNATGRKLLKRFKRLPTKLTVALATAKPVTASGVIRR